MDSKIAIKHQDPILLKVTGAVDEDGGSGVKAYHIYYATTVSGVYPTVDDAQLLTSISNLTSITSTLNPAGETVSGYPSWEAYETPSGVIRDHYHWDHVFTYPFYEWTSDVWYSFWVVAEDFNGNCSALESGVHPSSPIYKNSFDDQVVTAQNIRPRASINNNLFLITGKGGAWEYVNGGGIEIPDYVTVPLESEILVINSDRTSVVSKQLYGGDNYFEGTLNSKILFVKVNDWDTPETDLLVSGIEATSAHLLTPYDLILGHVDAPYNNFMTLYYGGKSKIIHSNGYMSNLLADTHTQYLLVDGTRAMGGTLNMGSQNITNVGTVDGVDVSDLNGGYLYRSTPSLGSTTFPTVNDGSAAWVSILSIPYIHRTGISTIRCAGEGYVSGSTGNWRLGVSGGSSGTSATVTNTGTYKRLTDVSLTVSSLTVGTLYDILVQIQSASLQTIYFRKPVVWLDSPT